MNEAYAAAILEAEAAIQKHNEAIKAKWIAFDAWQKSQTPESNAAWEAAYDADTDTYEIAAAAIVKADAIATAIGEPLHYFE